MFAKIKITAKLTVITGLHIGDSKGFSAIGAIDSSVIRDPFSGDPMIPGSSLKGKIRTLLARSYLQKNEYILKSCDKDAPAITRLFGSAEPVKTARLQFSDAFMTNAEKMRRRGGTTEDKAENFITRSTSIANPRHIERVARGAEFDVVWYYTAEAEGEIKQDMKTLAKGLCLLEMDYLGGSGTRGYGRVAFSDFRFEPLHDDFPLKTPELETIFKDVNSYAASLL